MSKEDTARSLLSWVTSGLSELDQEAQEADSASYEHVLADPTLHPSYHLRPVTEPKPRVPGPGPGSPPLEPANMPEPPELISPRANLSSSYDSSFHSTEAQDQEDDAKRAKSVQLLAC